MLDHLAWMLSDSTGIPPRFAKPAGMVQETYGNYNGAFLEGCAGDAARRRTFIELWTDAAAPQAAVPVRLRRQGQAGAPDGDVATRRGER